MLLGGASWYPSWGYWIQGSFKHYLLNCHVLFMGYLVMLKYLPGCSTHQQKWIYWWFLLWNMALWPWTVFLYTFSAVTIFLNYRWLIIWSIDLIAVTLHTSVSDRVWLWFVVVVENEDWIQSEQVGCLSVWWMILHFNLHLYLTSNSVI